MLSLDRIFSNPYEKPQLRNKFNPSNPLQIWKLNNDVDIEQSFFNVNDKSEPSMSLEDIQRNEARINENIRIRNEQRGLLNADAEDTQRADLLSMKDNEITNKYLQFLNKIESIPFLTADQKKVMEEKFLGELYEKNQAAFNVYHQPTLVDRNGDVAPDLIATLQKDIPSSLPEDFTPGARDVNELGEVRPQSSRATPQQQAIPATASPAVTRATQQKKQVKKTRLIVEQTAERMPTGRPKGRPRKEQDP